MLFQYSASSSDTERRNLMSHPHTHIYIYIHEKPKKSLVALGLTLELEPPQAGGACQMTLLACRRILFFEGGTLGRRSEGEPRPIQLFFSRRFLAPDREQDSGFAVCGKHNFGGKKDKEETPLDPVYSSGSFFSFFGGEADKSDKNLRLGYPGLMFCSRTHPPSIKVFLL